MIRVGHFSVHAPVVIIRDTIVSWLLYDPWANVNLIAGHLATEKRFKVILEFDIRISPLDRTVLELGFRAYRVPLGVDKHHTYGEITTYGVFDVTKCFSAVIHQQPTLQQPTTNSKPVTDDFLIWYAEGAQVLFSIKDPTFSLHWYVIFCPAWGYMKFCSETTSDQHCAWPDHTGKDCPLWSAETCHSGMCPLLSGIDTPTSTPL